MTSARKIVRLAASGVLAAGLVAGGLEVGDGAQPQANAAPAVKLYWAPGEMPQFPGSLEFPLGESLGINGMPVRISHFSSRETPEQVRDFYVEALSQRDLDPRVERNAEGGYSISALEPNSASQIVIVVSPRKKGVDVFPSIIPVTADPNVPGVAETDVPFSPQAVGLMRVSDGIAGSGVVTYQEPALRPGAALQHVRDEMGRRGWNIDEDSKQAQKSTSTISFRKGARRAHFTVSAYQGDSFGAAVVAQYGGPEEEVQR